MTAASGVGYALVALGPGLSLFVLTIASKPFLVLTLLTSTLAWLVCLVVIAGVWRGFLPLGTSIWPYIALLTTAVVFQEVVRVFFWRGFKKVEGFLDALAAKLSKPRLSFSEKIQIAIAIGFGHGLAHSVFFCLSLLTPALGPATFYLRSCPKMPFFLVVGFCVTVPALMSLGFLVIHTFSMVIAFNAYEEHKKSHQVFVPLLHLIASYLTLVNLIQGGCVAGIPFVMVCAGLTLAVCGRMVWEKTQ